MNQNKHKRKSEHQVSCSCSIWAYLFLSFGLGFQIPQWFFGTFYRIPGYDYSVRAEIFQVLAVASGISFIALTMTTLTSFRHKIDLNHSTAKAYLRSRFIILSVVLSVTSIVNILAISINLPHLLALPNGISNVLVFTALFGGLLLLVAITLSPFQLRSNLKVIDSIEFSPI